MESVAGTYSRSVPKAHGSLIREVSTVWFVAPFARSAPDIASRWYPHDANTECRIGTCRIWYADNGLRVGAYLGYLRRGVDHVIHHESQLVVAYARSVPNTA
eukprot:2624144-Rhodomonas_salina.1